jgi:retron-type reverse transcriptase
MIGKPNASLTWQSIDFEIVRAKVKQLQMRIAKAIREGKYRKAKSLQWLLTHSFYAKLLAVKRVTENRGAKTPGIDKVVWRTPKQKMQAVTTLKRRGYQTLPLRRIYIPKKDKSKLRPLSIPSMKCRAMQALYLLALEPVSETLIDKNSYGFRPKRSCADAIEQCFIVLARKGSAQYVLEGDIKSCFDKISHEWILNNIPMDKIILSILIKPSKKNVATFLSSIRGIIKTKLTAKCQHLIYMLNMKIKGWANYYRHAVSKVIFKKVDHNIFEALWKWAKRRHPNKSLTWVKNKYFMKVGNNNWIFSAGILVPYKGRAKLLTLLRTSSIPIVRHIKIQSNANPYDPEYKEYFEKREIRKKKIV